MGEQVFVDGAEQRTLGRQESEGNLILHHDELTLKGETQMWTRVGGHPYTLREDEGHRIDEC